jgi:hypothetical protein
MVKRRIHTDAVGGKAEILQPLGYRNGTYSSLFRKRWAFAGVTLMILFFFVASAESGMVYGGIFGVDQELQVGDTLSLFNEKGVRLEAKIKVDEYKGYTINLPQGIYRVEFNKSGNTWEAWIQSFPQSIRQDINFQKKVREK